MEEKENTLANTEKIYSPVDSYQNYYKQLHSDNTSNLFNKLVEESQIDIEANRATNLKIAENDEKNAGNNKAIKWRSFFRIVGSSLLAASVIVILYQAYLFWSTQYLDENTIIVVSVAVIVLGLSIWLVNKTHKKLKVLRNIEGELLEISNKLKSEAADQMGPLNHLLIKNYNKELFTKTLPLVNFDEMFDNKRLHQMMSKYGLNADEHRENMEQSTLYVQSGQIKGNPFFIRNNLRHSMGTKTYEGSIVIRWTTTERDSDGKYRTVNHSQTLTATVKKPCPYYYKSSQLVYANEAGERLSFSRQPSQIHELKPKRIQSTIKSRSKELQKLAEKSMKNGGTFTPLGNDEFDALFYSKDRDNESQFRLLFTPLAQREMTKIIRDNSAGYGDDFTFYKRKMINYLYPEHLKDIELHTNDNYFIGIDYDKVAQNFKDYHNSYFRHIYFAFAPVFAIPLYSQHQTQEYIYKDLYESCVSFYQHEMAANCISKGDIKPHDSATHSIVKTSLVSSKDNMDTIAVKAWGYRTVKRTDYVSMRGGDGYWHDVPVHWTEYIKVSKESTIEIKVANNNEEVDATKADFDKLRLGLIMARIVK